MKPGALKHPVTRWGHQNNLSSPSHRQRREENEANRIVFPSLSKVPIVYH